MSMHPTKRAIRFVRNKKEMKKNLEGLKHLACVHCGRVGTLNRHDTLHGNDLFAANKQTERGRRAWCSDRGKRNGCGRTMAIVLAHVLPRHSLTAPMLDRLLGGLRKWRSIQATWEHNRIPAPLTSIYRLLQRFRRRLDVVRTALTKRCAPPAAAGHRDILSHTAEHLRCAFVSARCAVAAFQYAFQTPIMG